MEKEITKRGFQVIRHPGYTQYDPRERCIVQTSSQIGDYEDSAAKPGSSYLWVGDIHHLNREQVAELVGYLQHWLAGGRLFKGD